MYGQKRVEGGVGQSREPKLMVCCLRTSAHLFLAKNRPRAPVFGNCPFQKHGPAMLTKALVVAPAATNSERLTTKQHETSLVCVRAQSPTGLALVPYVERGGQAWLKKC